MQVTNYEVPNFLGHSLNSTKYSTFNNSFCPQNWPHLELFLPVDWTHFQREFATFTSAFKLFWPHQAANLLLVADSESKDRRKLSEEFLSTATFCNSSRVTLNDPNPYYGSKGHDRQQLLMFWADNFTSAEYVGFLDSDTILTTIVDIRDIFKDDKPRVIGFYRKEKEVNFWTKISKSTSWFTGKKEIMRCMSYFPVVIKTEHLKDLREYIVKLHGASSFNAIYSHLIGTPYSQFNIMCNYLWYFRRNQYSWHIQESSAAKNWKTPPGRVENPRTVYGSTPEMFHPIPKIATHGYKRSINWQKDAIRISVCFALKDYPIEIIGDFEPDCGRYLEDSKLNPFFFDHFEPTPLSWMWHPAVPEADRERKERIKNTGCLPRWNEQDLKIVF